MVLKPVCTRDNSSEIQNQLTINTDSGFQGKFEPASYFLLTYDLIDLKKK